MSHWRRRTAGIAAVSKPPIATSTDPELDGLYQVYDRDVRKWHVIDMTTGEILKSKGGGPWPSSIPRKEL